MTIDVHVSLFRYPSRRLPLDEPTLLVKALQDSGVQQAWAGSFESMLCQDIAGVNQRLADACRDHGQGVLVPFGTVHPLQPDWEEDLRRCAEVHQMPGIRLLPGYHGYGLNEEPVVNLLRAARDRQLIVQLCVRLEDPRTQHRLLSVPDVDLQPLRELLLLLPGLRIVLLNAGAAATQPLLAELATTGQVWLDIASLEGLGGIERQLTLIPPQRVLFGSHAPFFIWESAELKLRESAIPESVRGQIRQDNAAALLMVPAVR